MRPCTVLNESFARGLRFSKRVIVGRVKNRVENRASRLVGRC